MKPRYQYYFHTITGVGGEAKLETWKELIVLEITKMEAR